MAPQISIIIPTYKRLGILPLIYQKAHDSLQNIAGEIIIVNDDETVTESDILHAINGVGENTLVINNRKKGVAAARNLGAELAKAELLLFLDDDMIINDHALARIMALHNRHDKILSTPIWVYSPQMLQLLESSPFGRYRIKYDYTSIRGKHENELRTDANVFEVDTLAAFCLSVKKKHYNSLQGMDEDYPYAGCEDQDFASRATAAGFQLLLDENVTVLHHELDRVERRTWLRRQFSGVQTFIYLAEKFPQNKKITLWTENTPISKEDSLSLKLKKVFKIFMRQDLMIKLFNFIIGLCEKFKMPDKYLYRLYTIQAGIYINKGFNKAYKTLNY